MEPGELLHQSSHVATSAPRPRPPSISRGAGEQMLAVWARPSAWKGSSSGAHQSAAIQTGRQSRRLGRRRGLRRRRAAAGGGTGTGGRSGSLRPHTCSVSGPHRGCFQAPATLRPFTLVCSFYLGADPPLPQLQRPPLPPPPPGSDLCPLSEGQRRET